MRNDLLLVPMLITALAGGWAAEPAGPTTADYLAAARAVDDGYRLRFGRMINDLKDADQQRRLLAIAELSYAVDPDALPHLLPLLEPGNPDTVVIAAVCTALGRLGFAQAVGAMRPLLHHADEEVRTAAFNALERINGLGNGDFLVRAKDDASTVLRRASLTNLGAAAHAEAAELLTQGLRHADDPLTRRMCALALGRLGDRARGGELKVALCDADPKVRIAAGRALVQLDYKPAILDLLMALESNVAGEELSVCLFRLAGDRFGFDHRSNQIQRQAAIERGYAWWTLHPELKQP